MNLYNNLSTEQSGAPAPRSVPEFDSEQNSNHHLSAPDGADIEFDGTSAANDRIKFASLWRAYYPDDHQKHETDFQCFRVFTELLDTGHDPDEIIAGLTEDRPPLLIDFLQGMQDEHP
jgi:hypothetical protein